MIVNTDSVFKSICRRHFDILYSPLVVTEIKYTAEMERLSGSVLTVFSSGW